ncbi:WD40 repeat domain-containing serine/threonine protein kinase [Actinomadura rupiterrae]|uniref:WD40 repeat domain-containing serine/threonine protein kinase n=1 Tax=Actinomadura rupiterrae TaxID=559627 RepID=UPI0020A52384|nr:serine/threonine-protein kinase [Actinomadura rupiterrae]MCP2340721.1 serine/threonine protein kinase [Actinomadura rupiterrae]
MEALRPGDPRQIGPYRLESRLGSGGMGRVFLGVSPGGRQVAVKVIEAGHAEDPRFRRRFAREINAARKVGGFHTAQVVDADPDAPEPWLATAFIPGPSLREVVATRGPLGRDDLRALAAGLAEGLTAIHAHGLVHRDLKPENVIMAADGPRIIDFGVARAADATSLTSAGVVVGTYAFMAPEQVLAGPPEPASDVFSYGCLLAFAAAGVGPFDADTIPAIVHRVLNDVPELEAVPDVLRTLVSVCLAKDPAARPTVQQVLAHLTDPNSGALPTPSLAALLRAPEVEPEIEPLEPHPTPDGPTQLSSTMLATREYSEPPAVPPAPSPQSPPAQSPLQQPAPQGPAPHAVDGQAADPHAQGPQAVGPQGPGPHAAGPHGLGPHGPGAHAVGAHGQGPQGPGAHAVGAHGQGPQGPGPHVVGPHAQVPALARGASVDGGRRALLIGGGAAVAAAAIGVPVALLLGDSGGKKKAAQPKKAPLIAFVSPVATLSGHTQGVRSVAFSPDRKYLVSGSDDSTIIIWDIAAGHPARTLRGHTSSVLSVAVSPDGSTVASAALDRSVRLWDAATGALKQTLPTVEFGPVSVAFSPDGSLLAGCNPDIWIWDARSGRKLRTLTGSGNSGVHDVAFSSDGRTVAAVTDGYYKKAPGSSVLMYDPVSGRRTGTLTGHKDSVRALAFLPDGKSAAAAGNEGIVRIWDYRSGTTTGTITVGGGAIHSLAATPDGRTLVVGNTDRTVRRFDLATRAPAGTLTGPASDIESVRVSPDGSLIAAGSGNGSDADPNVYLWKAR